MKKKYVAASQLTSYEISSVVNEGDEYRFNTQETRIVLVINQGTSHDNLMDILAGYYDDEIETQIMENKMNKQKRNIAYDYQDIKNIQINVSRCDDMMMELEMDIKMSDGQIYRHYELHETENMIDCINNGFSPLISIDRKDLVIQ